MTDFPPTYSSSVVENKMMKDPPNIFSQCFILIMSVSKIFHVVFFGGIYPRPKLGGAILPVPRIQYFLFAEHQGCQKLCLATGRK